MSIGQPSTRQDVFNWCRENQITFTTSDGEKEPPYGWNWVYPDNATQPLRLECRFAGHAHLLVSREDVVYNLPPNSAPILDGKGKLVGIAGLGPAFDMSNTDNQARREVIEWARANKVRFNGTDPNPPASSGWNWEVRYDDYQPYYVLNNSQRKAGEDEETIGFHDVWPDIDIDDPDPGATMEAMAALATRQSNEASRPDPHVHRWEDINGKLDAGSKAREKLMVRAKRKAKRVLLWTILIVVLAFVAALGGVIYWASKNVQTGYTMVEKQCGIQVGSTFLKATREYSYRYYEVLGARLNFNRDVQEKTILWLDGQSTAVMGVGDKDWWGLTTDSGDRGRQVLKPAKLFTFTIGKSMNVVDYEEFCKPQPPTEDGVDQVAKSDVKPTPKK